jgi:hypothetical protein
MADRFYNELNNLTTAGFYAISTKKAGKYYEVESVIASEKDKDKSTVIYINFALFFSNIQNRDICIYLKLCQSLRYFVQIFKVGFSMK